MRELVKTSYLRASLPVSLTVFAACLPYISATTPAGPLRDARVCLLFPVVVVLAQACAAWIGRRREAWRAAVPKVARHTWSLLVGAAVLGALVALLVIDPLLIRHVPTSFPQNVREFLFTLPWVALFQSLVLVAGTFAFAYRLSKRVYVAIAAVVLAHQILLVLQFRGFLSPAVLTCLVLVAGIEGFVAALSYYWCGLAGPVLISSLCYLRHIFRLL